MRPIGLDVVGRPDLFPSLLRPPRLLGLLVLLWLIRYIVDWLRALLEWFLPWFLLSELTLHFLLSIHGLPAASVWLEVLLQHLKQFCDASRPNSVQVVLTRAYPKACDSVIYYLAFVFTFPSNWGRVAKLKCRGHGSASIADDSGVANLAWIVAERSAVYAMITLQILAMLFCISWISCHKLKPGAALPFPRIQSTSRKRWRDKRTLHTN